MFHPLITLLASRPQLLATHAGGYAELALAESEVLAAAFARRVLLQAVAVVLGILAAVTGSTAALLYAALPVAAMPAAWLLWALPTALLAIAVVLGWRARRTALPPAWAALRAQWAEDMGLLQRLEDA
jgi:hypothetical protein